jgi:hypothetical protein
MKFFVYCQCLLSFCILPPLPSESELLPIQHIEAEHIDFDEKTIHLVGTVKVIHEFGVIQCHEATLFLHQEKKTNETLPVERILLKTSVMIDFSKGSRLFADEGTINCSTLEGTFISEPPNKVIYLSHSAEEPSSTPLKATSSALQAKITKTSRGYELSSLKGEGAVRVECLSKEEFQKEYERIQP